MAPKAVLFDVDGTLIDSIPLYARVLEQFSASRDSIESQLREGENIVRLLRSYGVSRDEFARQCVDLADERLAYTGTSQVLQRLRTEGVPVGIVTNLPRALTSPLLESLTWLSLFQASAYAASKPRPTGVFSVLKRLGIAPSKTIVFVGDHVRDQRAAHSAGVRFAWASYGYGKVETQMDDILLTNISDLLRV